MAPTSPSFAKVALEQLNAGNPRAALDTCLEGTAKFPWYATGSLVLGKCYDALGKPSEALQAYRDAYALLPDSKALQNLVKDMENRVNNDGAAKSSDMDGIIQQLQQAKRIVPSGDIVKYQEPLVPSLEGPRSLIVTETLAEIYAMQGEYREAIDAYRKLLQQRPENTEKYEKRLEELEKLLRDQLPPVS